jgi:pathogenesis-related protein 1
MVSLIMRIILALILLTSLPAQSARDAGMPQEFLKAHNAVRAALGLPPVGWSYKLADAARSWANSLVLYSRFQHSRMGYGENLYEIRGGKATPKQVVEAWASEAVDYDYQSNRCRGPKCGHYTQIVWRDTNTIGCGVYRSSFREVWVCEYSPPGNYTGQRPY